MLKKIQILSELSPLLSNSLQHLYSAFGLFFLAHNAEVQPSYTENHLPDFPLPLSILVQLTFQFRLELNDLFIVLVNFSFKQLAFMSIFIIILFFSFA